MRHHVRILGLTLSLLLVPAFATAGGQDARVSATLDGKAVSVEDAAAPGNHCLIVADTDLRCFAKQRDRDALADDLASRVSAELTASSLYTIAYVDANYGGGSLGIASDVANLHAFGFGDKITSLESATNKKPVWHQHTGYGGLNWSWGRGANVANVGSTANDQFSSVEANS